MAKRMLLHFGKRGFPSYEWVDEQGMPRPCALGVPWVNEDTLTTLARLPIPRTDPWGRPLPASESEAEVPGTRGSRPTGTKWRRVIGGGSGLRYTCCTTVDSCHRSRLV